MWDIKQSHTGYFRRNTLVVLGAPVERRLRGIQLKLLRRKADLTQAQLSEKSGLYQSIISRLESGRMDLTADHIEALRGPLKCGYAEFFKEPPTED